MCVCSVCVWCPFSPLLAGETDPVVAIFQCLKDPPFPLHTQTQRLSLPNSRNPAPPPSLPCVCLPHLTDLQLGKFTVKLNHRRLLDAMLAIAGVPAQKFRPICRCVLRVCVRSFKHLCHSSKVLASTFRVPVELEHHVLCMRTWCSITTGILRWLARDRGSERQRDYTLLPQQQPQGSVDSCDPGG